MIDPAGSGPPPVDYMAAIERADTKVADAQRGRRYPPTGAAASSSTVRRVIATFAVVAFLVWIARIFNVI